MQLQFPEYNKATNDVLEGLQRFVAFAQKYAGSKLIDVELRVIDKFRKEYGDHEGIRQWYEVHNCFMLDNISSCDIQAIAIRAYLDQVNWEFVFGYVMTGLSQVAQEVA